MIKSQHLSTAQHGLNGPCPVNALRQGDVGQKDDVDAFYASLNSYVRYFYEDDESGWGYSPFRQFRYLQSLDYCLLMLLECSL